MTGLNAMDAICAYFGAIIFVTIVWVVVWLFCVTYGCDSNSIKIRNQHKTELLLYSIAFHKSL